MHRLVYSFVAEKEIDDLDNHIFIRVDAAIHSLKENPFSLKVTPRFSCAAYNLKVSFEGIMLY